jgi:hypothetical protein
MASNDITTLLAREMNRSDTYRSDTASNFTPIIVAASELLMSGDFCIQNWPTKVVATNKGDKLEPIDQKPQDTSDRYLCLD